MNLEYWDETTVRFLRLYYRKVGDTELAEVFTRHFPKRKGWTKKHIEKKRRYLFLKRSPQEISDIKKRNTELGKYAMCAVNMWKTRGVAAVGDVRIWVHGGCEMAFVKTEKGFVPRNRWLWKNAYGELSSTDVIRSLPGAPIIAELHHLEKITNAENGIRNKALPRSIIKTLFKIKDNALAQQIADDYPEIVELKKNMLNLKNKLNESNRKIN
ncbi:hypothetical protein [Flavobacterium oncorhynchi]|nr:hypothetical protein [Flavobacterium oncorhynchi]